MIARASAAVAAVFALGLGACAQDEASPPADNDRQAELSPQQDFEDAQLPPDLGTTTLEVDSPPDRVDEGIDRLDAANELDSN